MRRHVHVVDDAAVRLRPSIVIEPVADDDEDDVHRHSSDDDDEGDALGDRVSSSTAGVHDSYDISTTDEPHPQHQHDDDDDDEQDDYDRLSAVRLRRLLRARREHLFRASTLSRRGSGGAHSLLAEADRVAEALSPTAHRSEASSSSSSSLDEARRSASSIARPSSAPPPLSAHRSWLARPADEMSHGDESTTIAAAAVVASSPPPPPLKRPTITPRRWRSAREPNNDNSDTDEEDHSAEPRLVAEVWADADSESSVSDFDGHPAARADVLSFAAQELEYQLRGAETTARELDERIAQQRFEQLRSEEHKLHDAVVESVEARTKRAARYIRAALDGRHIINGTGRLFEAAFFLQTQTYVRLLPMLANTAHVLFVFWEPPNRTAAVEDTASFPLESQRAMVGVELLFCAIYALFLASRLTYYGWHTFVRRWYNVVYLVSAILMTVDACVALGVGPSALRWSRPFRPLLVITNSARLRTLAVAMFKTLPAVADVYGVMALLAVVYAVIGLQLFGGLYVDVDSGAPLVENFDTFPDAFISLAVLTSIENYPDIMYPALRASPWSAVFFVSFILLQAFLLMSVLIAAAFNRFLEQNRRQVVARRALQRRGLLSAFAALDFNNTADLAFEDLFRLLRELRGSAIDREEARAVFDALDVDGSGSIDVLEFFRLTDVLLLHFYRLPRRHEHHRTTRFNRMRRRLLAIVSSRWFNVLSGALVVLSFVAICVTVALSDDLALVAALDIVDIVVSLLFLVEVVMRMVALGVREFFRSGWLVFDLLVVLVSLVFPILTALESVGVSTSVLVLRVFRLGRLLKAMRLFGASLRFRIVTMTYVYLFPMMWRVLALLAAVLVAYGIVGMELFGGSAMRRYSDGHASFDTSFAALVTVFQLFTTSNWHDVMFAATQATSQWAAIYFISFFFMVVRFVTVLLLALIIESFSMAIETFDDAALHMQLEQRPALVSAAATAAAAAAVSPKQNEWVARRTRRFSFSEMFSDGNNDELSMLARDNRLAADAGVASERMEQYVARAKSGVFVKNGGV